MTGTQPRTDESSVAQKHSPRPEQDLRADSFEYQRCTAVTKLEVCFKVCQKYGPFKRLDSVLVHRCRSSISTLGVAMETLGRMSDIWRRTREAESFIAFLKVTYQFHESGSSRAAENSSRRRNRE